MQITLNFQPISEGLPPSGKRVCVLTKEAGLSIAFHYDFDPGKFYVFDAEYSVEVPGTVTHWAERPAGDGEPVL